MPWFTLYVTSHILYTISLFLAFRFASKHTYAVLYWSAEFLDLLLQVAVIFEIAGIVLRRSARWVPGTRVRLSLIGLMAPLMAFGMAWSMNPAAESRLDALDARASVFTTVLVFLMFLGVVVASRQLGLGWRTYIMRESYGLFIWVTVAFLTDGLHAYWRTLGHFTLLENVRIAVYQMVTSYWIIVFWLPEPALRSMAAENKNSLEALAERLEYAHRSSRASTTDGIVPK